MADNTTQKIARQLNEAPSDLAASLKLSSALRRAGKPRFYYVWPELMGDQPSPCPQAVKIYFHGMFRGNQVYNHECWGFVISSLEEVLFCIDNPLTSHEAHSRGRIVDTYLNKIYYLAGGKRRMGSIDANAIANVAYLTEEKVVRPAPTPQRTFLAGTEEEVVVPGDGSYEDTSRVHLCYGTESEVIRYREGTTVYQAFESVAPALGLDTNRALVFRCGGQMVSATDFVEAGHSYTTSTASPAEQNIQDLF